MSERAKANFMPSETPSRRQRLASYVAFAVVGLFAATQFYGADPRPWGLAAGWAAGIFVVFGPIAWLARDRLSPERYETLTYVAAGGAMLLATVWVGVALAFAPRLFPYGPGPLAGGAVGIAVVLIAERAVVPERLRGAGL